MKDIELYKLRFVITYMTTYLDEFLSLYEKKNTLDLKNMIFQDEFDPEVQEIKKENYEIPINNSIFYFKIGQYDQLMKLFEKLNFKREQNKKMNVEYLSCEKTQANYDKVKEVNALLKQLQNIRF